LNKGKIINPVIDRSNSKRAYRWIGLLCSIAVALWIGSASVGCSSRVADKKAYSVARVDTIHGIAYPYEFTRARDLIDNGLYESAAYDYLMLYPQFKDSVVHECLRMDSVLQVNHVKKSVTYYLKQCLVSDLPQDPDVFHDSAADPAAVHKLYTWDAALLDDLAEYGIK
jgi:hypothetical protein